VEKGKNRYNIQSVITKQGRYSDRLDFFAGSYNFQGRKRTRDLGEKWKRK
jgi:hypothetical protein